MDRMVTKWNEDYEAALRALHLEDCLPCGGSGWVTTESHTFGAIVLTGFTNCTLCKGKGRILPPGCYGRLVVAKNPFPDESTGVKILAHKSRYGIKAIGWPLTRPPPEDDSRPTKRRSFLLSLLAPALAFLGIGRDRIPGAVSMVIEGPGAKLVFPNVKITSRSPFQDLADINVQDWSSFPVYRWTDTPTYYDPRRVAPRTTEGDPFS